MTMQSEDFGRASSPETLIPGTLRVYRHFQILPDGALVSPSAWGIMEAYSWIPKVPDSLFTVSYRGTRGMGWQDMSAVTFTRGIQKAVCLLGMSSLVPQDRHSAPAPFPPCRCGFYAHYDPHGSFYTAVSFWSGVQKRGSVAPLPVKAACQVSGRVIMGEKGVRAERIEILGLAPGEIRWCKDPTGQHLTFAAVRYQVPVFESVAEMAESFPPDDVSELLKR